LWSVGQTLYDKKNKELVLYLGVGVFSVKPIKNILKNSLPKELANKEFFGIMMIRRKNGRTEFLKNKEDKDNLTHIYDKKTGRIAIGKYSRGFFFGFLGEDVEDIRNMFPDESIFPDGERYIPGR